MKEEIEIKIMRMKDSSGKFYMMVSFSQCSKTHERCLELKSDRSLIMIITSQSSDFSYIYLHIPTISTSWLAVDVRFGDGSLLLLHILCFLVDCH